MSSVKKYYGKYRGTVVNNTDPMQKGRIQVMVPDVSNVALSSWAVPCVPISGIQSGVFALPAPGAGVWVEFEQGDPDYPIWVGGWWGSPADIPAIALAAPPPTPNLVMQTVGQNQITVFGAPGQGLVLSAGPVASPTSPKLVIAQSGILLSNGTATVTMVGSVVDINMGALTIT
jgi:uncharacterized protein involved in type VI secretion and phage assembly